MNQETPYFPIGIYRHYKGSLYTVFGLVEHAKLEQPLVLYGSSHPQWVLPLDDFLETVRVDGQSKLRFELITVMQMQWKAV